jgi:hypothetical protein
VDEAGHGQAAAAVLITVELVARGRIGRAVAGSAAALEAVAAEHPAAAG